MRKFTFMSVIFLCVSTALKAQTKNVSAVSQSSVKQMLQGKWQSLEDKKAFLMFEGDLKKEMYVGFSTWESEKVIIGNKCMNEGDKENGMTEKDKFISAPESDMCWYIVSINKDYLTLSYMGRGNTSKYKRVK